MQGKILADGIIKGEDGKRYTYQPSDIKGCDSPPPAQSEVDFEVKNGKAVDIIITNQPFDFDIGALLKRLKPSPKTIIIWLFILALPTFGLTLPFALVLGTWYILFGRKKQGWIE